MNVGRLVIDYVTVLSTLKMVSYGEETSLTWDLCSMFQQPKKGKK